MARGNAQILRRGYVAWEVGGAEAIMPWLDERFEWIQYSSFPGAKTYRGHDGVRRWDAVLGESWETREVEIEDLVERGDEVLVVLRLHVRGQGSGVDMEVPLAHLWTTRIGRGVRVQFYLTLRRAA